MKTRPEPWKQIYNSGHASQVNGALTIDDYIDFDRELCTNQSAISDKDIICEVLSHPVEESSEEDDDDDPGVIYKRKPLIEEVKSALEISEKISLYSDFSEDISKSIRQVSHFVEQEGHTKRKQTNITEFFWKNWLINQEIF